ncbi:Slp family lipoprotein [Arenimonas oryziterrae]|uniref:Slp family outer membrane lipoprotein n=1 Tax=Arenimonas oryziterrae DSM 21050 = YC6267 TaxID=1121015 RepID=A0A091AM24_9GAMM|nr:Slp family lipoprotein [Arenimonas oryziterrae]KFN41248.1 hypothetical protein N789_04995 [Arenimonas oryziterrae DSM 21050 = YC6267]
MKRLLILALPLLLIGCVTAPKPLQGQFSTLLPDEAVTRQAAGERVRWGGRVVKVEPQAARSCFEVVGAPLDAAGQPRKVDRSEGRFIACRTGFYDPEVFQAGREITIAGTIEGFETRKVGDFDYRYARVAAEVVYLWPERKDVDVIVHPVPIYW